MIDLIIRGSRARSDAFALTKAFFPEEEIRTSEEEQASETAYHVTVLRDGAAAAEVSADSGDGGTGVGIRNALKRKLYLALSGFTGRELPWGTLTGIRPTKIARDLLTQGISENNTEEVLRKFYYVSEEKTDLAMEITKREIDILSRGCRADGYSLYIGIPFCPTTCLYCSFTSYPISGWAGRTGEYLDAVEKELDFAAEFFRDRVLNTVYIGGGTPTTLSEEELTRLLRRVRESFDVSALQELTVEAGRPDSITPEKLAVLKESGATRISVNPQTMNEETLRLIGRRHTVVQTEESFRLARAAGFDNINMDIILGLPGEEEEEVRRTIGAIKSLGPDSLTVHSLALKRSSRLNRELNPEEREKGSALPDWLSRVSFQNTDAIMDIASSGAREMGLMPYYLYRQKNMAGNFENTGYARPGKEGLYNILIMEEVQDIVAIGAGTVSKHVIPGGKISRCDTSKEPRMYIDRIEEMIERKRNLFTEK